MKIRPKMFSPGGGRAGFSLIEMIGVMAIMAILATILVPNALKRIELAAIDAERSSIKALGEQTKLHFRSRGYLPGLKPTAPAPAWNIDLSSFGSLSPADVLTNRRSNSRSFLYDTASTPFPRVLILSSMRAGLTVPANATPTQFDAFWNAADNSVPGGLAAALFAANWAGQGDYLLIERVNLKSQLPINRIVLSANTSVPTTVTYVVLHPNGQNTPGSLTTVTANVTRTMSPDLMVRDGDIVVLRKPDGTDDYRYVVTGQNANFLYTDLKGWLPQ
jgi:prepilin-type N-terminal cleavage/methylation domain-containing protein